MIKVNTDAMDLQAERMAEIGKRTEQTEQRAETIMKRLMMQGKTYERLAEHLRKENGKLRMEAEAAGILSNKLREISESYKACENRVKAAGTGEAGEGRLRRVPIEAWPIYFTRRPEGPYRDLSWLFPPARRFPVPGAVPYYLYRLIFPGRRNHYIRRRLFGHRLRRGGFGNGRQLHLIPGRIRPLYELLYGRTIIPHEEIENIYRTTLAALVG